MPKEKPTGYEPLYALKNIAPDVWIADGVSPLTLSGGGYIVVKSDPNLTPWRVKFVMIGPTCETTFF